MNPKFPIYIVSKNRFDSRYTVKALTACKIPFRLVIEPQEFEQYKTVLPKDQILILPFSDVGSSIPARNWIWEHALSENHERHWILDDNIRNFVRLYRNLKVIVDSGVTFRAIEDFCDRYENIALASMQYDYLAKRKQKIAPIIFNTRVYSCILILNRLPFRWRGRYNEDTDLSLRVLKAGWVTAEFNAFLCSKVGTLLMRGGNTDELYQGNGRLKMAQSLENQHPDCVRINHKWGRFQHQVDYRSFKKNKLIRKAGIEISKEPNEYGMKLTTNGK